MKLLTFDSVQCIGVDDVGDVCFRLQCGHILGYPEQMIHDAARAGAGLRLGHSGCDRGLEAAFIAPEHTSAISDRLLGTQSGTSILAEEKTPKETGSKPESDPN